MFVFSTLIIIFISSLLLTNQIFHLARKKHWYDIPNNRSSHSLPTPKSGGLAFVIVFSLAMVYALVTNGIEWRNFFALSFAVVLGIIGFIDDLSGLNNKIRLCIQVSCVLCVLYILEGAPDIPLFSITVELGWVGVVLTAIAFTWFINLYNFMDGIDGIAALETIFVCLAASLFCWQQGQENISLIFNYLSVAVAGFVILNWPPAKIFMGDVGSNFLGFVLGCLGLITMAKGVMNIWTWSILLGIFVVDSSATLCYRFRSGEVWYQAHRSHCYQRAARKFNSHLKVDLIVTTINFFWLFPLAWVTVQQVRWGLVITVVAYLPLLCLCQFGRRFEFENERKNDER